MPTYEEAYNADTAKAKAARAKYGSLEKFTTAAKAWNTQQASKKRPDLERAQTTVNKTNVKAKGGAGTLPQQGAISHKDAGGNLIINESKPEGGSRATIHKAGSAGAKAMEEGSTIRSSESDPNTEYGKYKKSREGSGERTRGAVSAPVGNKTLSTGMGYTEEGGRRGGKLKYYNKEGKKVAVIKKPKTKKSGEVKRKAKVRLTKAGRKDEDTTLTKTKKSGVQKVKGAPKKDSARTVAKKALGVGSKNPDGSAKEVKRSAVRKKAGEVRTKRRKIKNQNY